MQARKLQFFVIHCTDTPEGRQVLPDQIRHWHMGPCLNPDRMTYTYKGSIYVSLEDLPKEKIGGVDIQFLQGRGWKKVGYSDMILLDGTLVNLIPYNTDDEVDPWEISNGVAGINGIARHIVYVGGKGADGKPKDTRTLAQLNTLKAWIRTTLHYAPNAVGAGHNQFDKKKACPSFHVPAYLSTIGIPDRNIYRDPQIHHV